MLYAIAPSRYARRSLHMILDIAAHSTFPEREWAKEQEVILDEIHSYEDSPSELIFDEFEDQVFRPHRLGHAILGTEASVGRITVEVQRRFHSTYYRPERMVLFARGVLNMDDLIAAAEQAFPGEGQPLLSSSTLPEPLPIPIYNKDISIYNKDISIYNKDINKEARRVVRRRDTAQSHVLLGRAAYSLYDPRRLALSLLASILGGSGMNARLNMQLREQRGLVYHVECNYTPYTDTGLFSVYFGSSHRAEAEAIELVYAELARLVAEPLTQRALEQALRQTRGQMIVASEQREQHFLSMGKSFLHTGTFESDEVLQERLSALTPELLHEVATELFDRSMFHELIYR